VQLPWTSDFDEERDRYALRFACEDCAHFEARTGCCRHEWPNESHRQEAARLALRVLDFCKEFELC